MDLQLQEAELLQAMIKGDEQGYQQAVQRYSAGMLATARVLVDSATAEDIVQDVWATVIDVIDQFEQRCSLQTWLNTITANRARSRLRKSWRELPLSDTESVMSQRFDHTGRWQRPFQAWDHVTPELLLQEQELQHCLDIHIAKLPENLRTVLLLRDILQLDTELICNIMNISASNFRVLLHRARQRIYIMLEQFEEKGIC